MTDTKKQLRFSIRKFTVGALSVIVGAIAFGVSANQVNAATASPAPQTTKQAVVKSDQTQTATASITYYDDATQKNIGIVETAQGKVGDEIKFSDSPESMIAFNENRGYKFVSSNYTNGQKYDIDNAKNQFVVHFKSYLEPDPNEKETTWTVKQVIHYQYSDGSIAAPDSVKTLIFKRPVYKDSVTFTRTYEKWDAPFKTFAPVTSPKIEGYTPNVLTTSPDKVIPPTLLPGNKHDVADVGRMLVITYTANTQNAKISYIDDSDNKVLATDESKGSFGKVINFSKNPVDQIAAFEKQGYELVSNNYTAGTKFASDDNKNVFEVHFKQIKQADPTPVSPTPQPSLPTPEPTEPVIPTPVKPEPVPAEPETVKPHAASNHKNNAVIEQTKKVEKNSSQNKAKLVQVSSKTNNSDNRVTAKKDQAQLPQTGAQKNGISLIGLLIGILAMFGLCVDRKHQD